MTRILTLAQAKALYVHRFTCENVPVWAMKQRSDGSYHAPHYRSDQEWYYLALFPGENGYDGDAVMFGNPTWPLGQSLRKPFNKAAYADLQQGVLKDWTVVDTSVGDNGREDLIRAIRKIAEESRAYYADSETRIEAGGCVTIRVPVVLLDRIAEL